MTCCKTASENCGDNAFATGADLTNINEAGCVQLLEEFIVDKVAIIGGIGIGIALLQIIGVIIACKIPKDD